MDLKGDKGPLIDNGAKAVEIPQVHEIRNENSNCDGNVNNSNIGGNTGPLVHKEKEGPEVGKGPGDVFSPMSEVAREITLDDLKDIEYKQDASQENYQPCPEDEMQEDEEEDEFSHQKMESADPKYNEYSHQKMEAADMKYKSSTQEGTDPSAVPTTTGNISGEEPVSKKAKLPEDEDHTQQQQQPPQQFATRKRITYKCSVCGHRTLYKPDMITHMKHHKASRVTKSYRCSVCNYSSTDRSVLVRHIIIHNGGKPYQCRTCDFQTNRSSHLVEHCKIHTG